MSLSEIATPDFKDTPYWWEAAPPDLEGDAPPPEEVDVAVIGSGYTGMSAALELAREGLRVLVMDAERFGEGASTRSGGMVSGGVNVGKGGDSEQRYGKDRVEAMIEEAGESYAHFEQLIAREGIDCHYARTGRFVGAHTPSAHRAQALKVAALNDHADAGAAIVARADQKGHVNTNYYHGGMTVDRSGGVHPALYHKGLRQACLRVGVVLSGNCRVHKVDG